MGQAYTVVFVREHDGRYSVFVPALKGCHTWGATLPEAVAMAEDAMRLHLESLQAHGEETPHDVDAVTIDLQDATEAVVYKVAVREAAPVA